MFACTAIYAERCAVWAASPPQYVCLAFLCRLTTIHINGERAEQAAHSGGSTLGHCQHKQRCFFLSFMRLQQRRKHLCIAVLLPGRVGMLSSTSRAPCHPLQGQKRQPFQLCIAPEVASALKAKRPVVALESTIISHGESCPPGGFEDLHRMACDAPGPPVPVPSISAGVPGRRMPARQLQEGPTLAATTWDQPCIAAGMPYPQNLATALEVEEVVRSHGATPATIAIIGGQCCIGEQLGPVLHCRALQPAL